MFEFIFQRAAWWQTDEQLINWWCNLLALQCTPNTIYYFPIANPRSISPRTFLVFFFLFFLCVPELSIHTHTDTHGRHIKYSWHHCSSHLVRARVPARMMLDSFLVHTHWRLKTFQVILILLIMVPVCCLPSCVCESSIHLVWVEKNILLSSIVIAWWLMMQECQQYSCVAPNPFHCHSCSLFWFILFFCFVAQSNCCCCCWFLCQS